MLHEHRLFPVEGGARAVAVQLYESIKDLPILSPHGHTDPSWFAENKPFPNPTALFIQPDHYIFRMLYSQGISLESLGVPQNGASGDPNAAQSADPREVWRIFARNYFLFRGTPTRMWLDHAFSTLFGLTERLSAGNADEYYDTIAGRLAQPEFLPRALYERFNLEVLATTDAAIDDLRWHRLIRDSGWHGRVLPTFRPDGVIDAEFAGFRQNIDRLGELTGEDVSGYQGYLAALRKRREYFRSLGATATDHLTAMSADLSADVAGQLYHRIYNGQMDPGDVELFQAQMLTEMAGMSVEDGMTMQLHPGSVRNHNKLVYERFGRDKGADIPAPTEYVRNLRPLLNKYGNSANFTFILFTLDESTYARELAPLAGHYPCLRLGPSWWFHDSPEGMMRFREQTTETAGFYNTVGFNDDTRALLSIPARHDVARRVDAAFLGRLVAEHRLDKEEAFEVIHDLTVNLVKKAYRL
jgi:glucuronate isomerase